MVNISINFQKKDLWLFSLITIFLVGIGFIIATEYQSLPIDQVFHPANEVWVKLANENEDEMTLQDAIDINAFDTSAELGDGLGTTTDIANITFSGYGNTACLILSGVNDGKVSCSGYNAEGQLGLGDTSRRITFKAVPLDTAQNPVQKIVGSGRHFCALLKGANAGKVMCWGRNSYGQLGISNTSTYLIPKHVRTTTTTLLIGIVDIEARRAYTGSYWVESTCALESTGKVYCWGYNNGNGILGDGSTSSKSVAVQVLGITNAKKIELGGHSTGSWSCVLLTNGTVMCWGYNGYGQLGVGDKTKKITPVPVNGLSNAKDIEVTPSDYGTACALLTTGNVMCWGYNARGQLGINTTVDSTIPALVNGITPTNPAVKLVSSGAGTRTSFCALLSDSTVKCWGDNYKGRIGLPDNSADNYKHPTDIGLSDVKDIKLLAWGDTGFGCALIEDGTVKCWGYNGYGQLGDGTTTDKYVATLVSGINSAKAIFLGGSYGGGQDACAILNDNSIRCWGYNANGQLGTGDLINYKIPTQPI